MKKIVSSLMILNTMALVAEDKKSDLCAVFNGLNVGVGLVYSSDTFTINSETKAYTPNTPNTPNAVNPITKNMLYSLKYNTIGGVVSLCYGNMMTSYPVYFGGEAYVDIAQKKEQAIGPDNKTNAVSNVVLTGFATKNSISYGFAGRVGYVNKKYSLMVYLKAGVENFKYSNIRIKGFDQLNVSSDINVSKFAPAIALGIEKSIHKRLSVRLEGAYRLKGTVKLDSTHRLSIGGSSDPNNTMQSGYLYSFKSLGARVIGAYNIKF